MARLARRWLWAGMMVGLWGAGALWGERRFPLPSVEQRVVWEAERALQGKEWRLVRHEGASGGAYVEPRLLPATLEFPVAADRSVSLRITPRFWRTGARLPARRFPYPLEALPGPDVVVAVGKRLFFTAPATGRLGIVALPLGTLVGHREVGGYLSDLLADEEQRRLYLADAEGNRVVMLDAETLKPLEAARVPSSPWSLARLGPWLLVACKEGKALAVLDAQRCSPQAEIPLPAPPLHVEAMEAPTPRVFVRFAPMVFRLADSRALEPERPLYPFGARTAVEQGTRNQPGWKRFSVAGPHRLRIEAFTEKGIVSRIVEVQEVTGGPPVKGIGSPPLVEQPGPAALALVGNLLFFTSPSTGRLGVLDTAKESLLPFLALEGYLTDLVAFRSKLYVADALNHRLWVVEAGQRKVLRSLATPGQPWSLDVYTPTWWTQHQAGSPRLLVACREGKQVVLLDPESDRVLRTLPLPAGGVGVRVILPPNPDWWPNIPSERLERENTVRFAVALEPLVLEPKEWKPRAEAIPSLSFVRRNQVRLPMEGGAQRLIVADNLHTLRWAVEKEGKVVEERWLDVSSITDPRFLRRPLGPKDEPGVLSIGEGGLFYPWRQEIWMTPDQGILLWEGSEEFRRWNSPILRLSPGSHRIVVRAHQPDVRLDGLLVERVLEGEVSFRIVAEVAPVSLPERSRNVFYDREPVRLRLEVVNETPRSQSGRWRYRVRSLAGLESHEGEKPWSLAPKGDGSFLVEPTLKEWGVFEVQAEVRTANGREGRTFYFLRMPPLTRPRILLRPEEVARAKERIRKFEPLFRRYFAWLKEEMGRPNFLPAGLTAGAFGPKLPEAERKLSQRGIWRRYDYGWRMIALAFAALMSEGQERETFLRPLLEILKEGQSSGYCHFHHHGPFFPGCDAALYDLVVAAAGGERPELKPLGEFFRRYLGDMNVFPWTLTAMQDPPSLRERELLSHLATWFVNIHHYFSAHAGTRGGTWWLNQRTACHCPFGAYAFAFLYLRNFFGMEHLHEQPFIQGFLTHALLSRPRYETKGLLGPPGPPGEPQRWITAMLARHPLMKRFYDWEPLLERLLSEEPWSEETRKAMTFPTSAANAAPVPFVLPIGLALGWYDPEAPEVGYEELPPTLLFDKEGEVVMRSDWGPQATEVFFACGLRDHVYRHQPTHLMVLKGGEMLLGTGSLQGDHGCPSLDISRGNSWGNVVVIEPSDWRSRWRNNLYHPRGEEYCLTNRFTDATFRAIQRDRRLTGYAPAEGGYGGGLDLHGHTQSFLVQEGEILAFETRPEFDYVAGDATNSWRVEEAQEVLRQVVYLKPNLLVVYDRVKLGHRARRAFWLAATGPSLSVEGQRFLVRNGDAFLSGTVLFPSSAQLLPYDPAEEARYRPLFDPAGLKQHKVLEVHSPGRGDVVEFLVTMEIGLGEPASGLQALQSQVSEDWLGATFRRGEETLWVRFARRSDLPAGELVRQRGRKRVVHRFTQRVEDDYRHWRVDPRFPHWAKEERFRFILAQP